MDKKITKTPVEKRKRLLVEILSLLEKSEGKVKTVTGQSVTNRDGGTFFCFASTFSSSFFLFLQQSMGVESLSIL